jgi:hypothetical protein
MAAKQSTTTPARAHILGHLSDGISFIETACKALEENDRTAFAMPCLRQGIDMVRHVHTVLDLTDDVTVVRRTRPRTKPKRKGVAR